MQTAYTVCMVVGIGIPLISLVFGQLLDFLDGIFEFFDGLDIDIDLELGDTGIPLVPASLQSICAGLLVFGTVGKITFNGGNYLFANILAAVLGYVAALLIQMLINKLKKVEHKPMSKEELSFCITRVTNTIKENSYGKVSVKTDGGTISYPAKSLDHAEIRQGAYVDIIKFEKNTAIVQTSKLSEEYPQLFED